MFLSKVKFLLLLLYVKLRSASILWSPKFWELLPPRKWTWWVWKHSHPLCACAREDTWVHPVCFQKRSWRISHTCIMSLINITVRCIPVLGHPTALEQHQSQLQPPGKIFTFLWHTGFLQTSDLFGPCPSVTAFPFQLAVSVVLEADDQEETFML